MSIKIFAPLKRIEDKFSEMIVLETLGDDRQQ